MAYLSESTVSVKTGKSRPGEKKRRKIMPSEKERCKGRNDLEIRRGHVDEVHRMNRQARLRRTDKDLGNTARKEASRHPISSASRIGHRTKGGRLPTSSSTSRPRDDDAATTASLEEPDGPESQDQAKEIDPTLARARTVRHSPTILAESSPTPKMSRTTSIRDSASKKALTPQKRSQTTIQTRRVSSKEVSKPTALAVRPVRRRESAPSTVQDRRRSTSLFLSLFRSPPLPRTPEKKVECLTCLSDDIPVSKSAKLACGHVMCHECLKRIFVLSVSDPQHMPPRCCSQDHIPLKHVDRLFAAKFKMQWNRKYQEYTTKNRIYCPARGCGEWIKPAQIHVDSSADPAGARRYGKCGRCKTKICCQCNGRWHGRRECPNDEETTRFAEVAQREGWQRCHNCSAMVELKEGCNHMTCRCTAEFCMICGAKWKTCNCPWFNYEQVENDRLEHFNIAIDLQLPAEVVAEDPRPSDEEDERRRQQEEQDEGIARRLQTLRIDESVNAGGQAWEWWNSGGWNHPDDHRNNPLVPTPEVHHRSTFHPLVQDRRHEDPLRRTGDQEWRRWRRRPSHHDHNPIQPHETELRPPPGPELEIERHRQNLAMHLESPSAHFRGLERGLPPGADPDFEREHARNRPEERVRRPARSSEPRRHSSRRLSTLAGLTRPHGQGGRVGAWLQHVEDGGPANGFRGLDMPVTD